MEILFTNTEMELCWGSNKNNRFYKNLKALIPHMEYWVYGATTIKTSSSGCIVYFENSDVDKFLNNNKSFIIYYTRSPSRNKLFFSMKI